MKDFLNFLYGKIARSNSQKSKKILMVGIFLVVVALNFAVLQGIVKPLKIQVLKALSASTKDQSAQLTEIDKPFNFAQSVVKSLKEASKAKEIFSSINLTKGEADYQLKVKRDLKNALERIKFAGDELKPYLESKNENVQKSAQQFQVAYALLIQAIGGDTALLEKVRVSSPQEVSRGQEALSEEGRKNVAIANQGWKVLAYATIFATYALADYVREENGTRPYLTITKRETQVLLSDLERSFGASVKSGLQVGQHGAEAAPAIFWEFLHQPRKAADEK